MLDRLKTGAAARGAALACLLLVASQASAQLHRCEVNGRVTFSDRPCPGAVSPAGSSGTQAAPSATTPPTAAAAGDADLARRCAAGNAAACRTQQTLARHHRDMDELGRQCASGNALACDTLACVKSNDRSACARAEGRPASPAPPGVPNAAPGTPASAAGWSETGRRVETRPGRRTDGGATGDRYTVVSIRCGDGGLGMVEMGPGGVRIGGQGVPYTSLDEAAGRMCSRGR